MLSRDQLRRWIDHFGTPESQIRRDHLLSHVLLHLAGLASHTTFFGGTALSRTHLRDWRLSEDIDLLVEDAGPVGEVIDEFLPRSLRREFPGVSVAWEGSGETRSGAIRADDLSIRVQLVATDSSYRVYPTAVTQVALRYQDLPPTVDFVCPTVAGAAAMKLNAWAERRAARDLCDLFGLDRIGGISRDALAIAASASRPLQPHQFHENTLPTEQAWRAALAHQMREMPDRVVALAAVRRRIAVLSGSADS